MGNIFDWADQQISNLFKQWDSYTVILALALGVFITYSLLNSVEADLHPMILARQAHADRVRNPGESAVYRSPDAPHGTPLRSGLAVKLPTDKPYTAGRDGDLRHIWLRVTGEIAPPSIPGVTTSESKPINISTAFGREAVINHDIREMTREIAILGNYLSKNGSKRVAIYLPNTAEFLTSVFACAFFSLDIILLPFHRDNHDLAIEMLKSTKADALIAPAGSLALEDLTRNYTALKQVIWHVERTSRHMDWTEVPSGLGESLDVSMLHQIVQDHQGDAPLLSDLEKPIQSRIVTVWQDDPSQLSKVVEFTQANFMSAIAALIAAIPARQRINSSDVFFSADSWSNSYCLCQTLAALFSGASLVITSVAGPDVDLTFAAKNIAPTVVVVSAESAMQLHASAAPAVKSGLRKLSHSLQSQTLAAGALPSGGFVTNLAGATKSAIGSTPGTLRLLFITEKAGTTNPPISAHELNNLRIFSGARVVYVLTAAPVAGAVAQTNVYDYRVDSALSKHSHFGVPSSSLEVKVVDSSTHKTSDESARGEIVVSGPSVARGSANLGVMGTFRDDCTLAYV